MRFLKQSLVFVFLGLFLLPAMADSEPQKLIRGTSDEVLQLIKQKQQEYKQDPSQMYAMIDQKVLPHFDFNRMTDLALGRYRKKVKSDQRPQLVEAFRSLLVRTYGKALLEYTDQEIVYLPMRGSIDKGDVTVRTEIEQQGGFPIPLNYEMYIKDGEWKVYDISVDNISLVTNYRSSFAKEIKAKGIDGLIKRLQSRNKQES